MAERVVQTCCCYCAPTFHPLCCNLLHICVILFVADPNPAVGAYSAPPIETGRERGEEGKGKGRRKGKGGERVDLSPPRKKSWRRHCQNPILADFSMQNLL